MADLMVVLGVLAFFGLSVLFVIELDRLVGNNDDVVAAVTPDAAALDDPALSEAGR